MSVDIHKIRAKAKVEEIDYLFLMDCLRSYKQPRDKLTKFLKKGDLIRVKKGLYVFGESYRRRPYSLEILANLIYGPSYLSYEFALAYHGFIPEQVKQVTSACLKKGNYFQTPVGQFVYFYVSKDKFSIGLLWEKLDEFSFFLIASKEKAISDLLARRKAFEHSSDLLLYLEEGMRIHLEDLFSLDRNLMNEIASFYKNQNIDLLCQILSQCPNR